MRTTPLIAFFLYTLLTQAALAKVSALDTFLESSKNQSCNAIVSKMKLQDFAVSEISEKTKPLNQIQSGNTFFHYTNAQPVLKLLRSDVEDRDRAQALINAEGGLSAMMSHSYKSKGDNYAGRGIYLAGNPFTSRMFGDYQIAFTLSESTRTLQMNRDEFTAKIKSVIEEKLGPSCLNFVVSREIFFREETQLIESIILQASGVDLLLYDDTAMWSMLVNEDTIQGSKIIGGRGVNVITTMLTQDRLSEFTNHLYNYVQPSVASQRDKPYDPFNELVRSGEFDAFFNHVLSSSDEAQFKFLFGKFLPITSSLEKYQLYILGHGILKSQGTSEENIKKASRIVGLTCGKENSENGFISYLKSYPAQGAADLVDEVTMRKLSDMVPKSCD